MKILLITDLYPVKEDEVTTSRALYDFVQGWTEMGHEVKVLKPNFILNSFIRKKPYYKTGWYGNVFNVNYWLPFCGNVKEKLDEFYKVGFEPDIVVAHMPSGNLFADKLGVPFFAGVHCSDLTVLTSPLYIFFRKRLLEALRHAKKIFCRSHILKRELFDEYPEFLDKTSFAVSGVDEKYIIEDFTHEIDVKNLKIVTCANLIKRKNIDKLIRALKDYEKYHKGYNVNIQLTVIGDGPRRKSLERIYNKVIFTGRLPHDEVLKLMRESDIFILPSVNETFGLVYMEAMASGCIPVCSKLDGIEGIIQNGVNGFLVEPEVWSIKSLIWDIRSMDKEKLKLIRKYALKTARRYTQKICCEKYLEKLQQQD